MNLYKAFDSLNNNILLHKMTYYKVKNSAITILRSYLSNLKQYVQIDYITSSILSSNTGVSQGLNVGSLLINIFINDIIMSIDEFNFILYADNTTFNVTVESFGETAADMEISTKN